MAYSKISCDIALLLADKILDAKEMTFTNGLNKGINWENSDLRKWMNSTMLDSMFSSIEKGIIMHDQIDNSDIFGNKLDMTYDCLFLLSLEEYDVLPSELLTADATRYAQDNGYVINFKGVKDNSFLLDRFGQGHGYWWLRAKGKDSATMLCVDNRGELKDYGLGANYKLGVRPALFVNLQEFGRLGIIT